MAKYLNEKPVEPGKLRKGTPLPTTRFPKLDGIHTIVRVWEVDGVNLFRVFSRTGEHLPSLDDVAQFYVDHHIFMPGNVYFCEAWSATLPFQDISGRVRRKKEKVPHSIKLYPFDTVTEEEYESGATLRPWSQRVAKLCFHPGCPKEGIIPDLLLQEVDEGTALGMTVRKQEQPGPKDGIILRNILGGWALGPATSGNVVKLKPRPTYDLEIIGATVGKGKYAGQIGAFVVRTGEEKFCEVGTGLNDAMRSSPPADFIGLIAEVSCLGVNKTGKLREPAFLRWRLDKNAGDMPADDTEEE